MRKTNKRIRAKKEAKAIKAAREETVNETKALESRLKEFSEQMQAANLEIAAERGKVKMELAKAQNLADFALEKAKEELKREEALNDWTKDIYRKEQQLRQREIEIASIARRQKEISKWQNITAWVVLAASILNAIAIII